MSSNLDRLTADAMKLPLRDRVQLAQRLVSTLDEEVEARRPRKSSDNNGNGCPMSLENPEPWPDPIAGAGLLETMVSILNRHLILPEVGAEGQLKLLNSRVLCVGAGGLGCPISLYLAAAGVGTIGLADVDVLAIGAIESQHVVYDRSIGKTHAIAQRWGIGDFLETTTEQVQVGEEVLQV